MPCRAMPEGGRPLATGQSSVLSMLPVPTPQGIMVGDGRRSRPKVSGGLSLPGQTGREEDTAAADGAEVSAGKSLPLPLTSSVQL